jgi:hypothetical protein
MSTGEANADMLSKPKRSPWQFSLQKLLAVIGAVSVWCAIASWSLAAAVVWSLLAAYLAVPILAHRYKPLSMVQWTLALLPLVFLFVTFSSTCVLKIYYQPGTLEVCVKDADTKLPISNASVELSTWGNSAINVNSSVNGRGSLTAKFYATRHNLGWGRSRYDLQLRGTQLFLTAPGYEPKLIDWTHYTGQHLLPAEAPPAPPTEIFLKPVPMAANSP